MDLIKVRTDYAAHHDYRLLTIDREWLSAELQNVVFVKDDSAGEEEPQARTNGTTPGQRKRSRVCLVLHGGEQLHVHSHQSTDLVRRVEYSNTLLVASRRTSESAASAPPLADTTAEQVPPSATTKIVQAALSRVFEAQKGVPQTNVMALLRDSYITITELERGDASETVTAGQRHYSFDALARRVVCSPAELVSTLTSAGAIVLHGKVRLLHPTLVHDALRSTLIFLDGTPNVDVSWTDVETHLCPSAYPTIVLRVVRALYGHNKKSGEEAAADAPLLRSTKALVGLAGHAFETHTDTRRQVLATPKGATVECLTMPFDAFYEAWKDGNPSFLFTAALVEAGHTASLSDTRPDDLLPLLFGNVICERPNTVNYVGATVHWLPKDSLTTNVAGRIDALFAVKPQKWAAAELKTYIEPLLVEGQPFAHTVSRYAREYRVPGEPVTYSLLGA